VEVEVVQEPQNEEAVEVEAVEPQNEEEVGEVEAEVEAVQEP
jgi:hypothetical protein